MSDRRRTARFVIPEASEGWLRLMQDIFIEHTGADTVVVVTDEPLPRTEGLLVELPRELGARAVVQVQVASAAAIWCGETRRYRTILKSADPEAKDGPLGELGRTPLPLPAIGVLIRRVPVRLRDVSAAGCLLETSDALPEGSIGLLELVVNGQRHSETLQISRSVRLTGSAGPWRSGAHFLSFMAPLPTSVRNVVARFEIIDELGDMPDSLARMYRRLPPPPACVGGIGPEAARDDAPEPAGLLD